MKEQIEKTMTSLWIIPTVLYVVVFLIFEFCLSNGVESNWNRIILLIMSVFIELVALLYFSYSVVVSQYLLILLSFRSSLWCSDRFCLKSSKRIWEQRFIKRISFSFSILIKRWDRASPAELAGIYIFSNFEVWVFLEELVFNFLLLFMFLLKGIVRIAANYI